jgi:Domain of unknown function (DUF4190)/Domain of unknown function (DUF1707)
VGPESPTGLRASDADREAAVGRLRVAAMEGRLDADELAERVSVAYRAKWCQELDRLVADVTPFSHAATAAPVRFVQRPVVSRTNGLAIASLVFAVFWFAWMGSIAAIVCGHIALGQIRDRAQGGRGLAIAGLAIGYLQLLTLAVAVLYRVGA